MMAKRLFLLILGSLWGIFGAISAPGVLTAAETAEVTGVRFWEAETVLEVEEVSPSGSEADNGVVAPVTYTETARETVVAEDYVAPAPGNSIAIAGRVLEIVEVDNTTVDAGDHVNKYGEKLLYGHNSAGVFGGLSSVHVGNVFTVSLGGASNNYQVAKIVIFEKNVATGQLQLDGSGNYMRSVANARSEGVQYDLALMTCHGTAYGNGDASHRLVIFANRI